MVIMTFLARLPSKFETVKSQILSSSEITSLKDVFNRVLCIESTPANQQTNVLVVKEGGGKEIMQGDGTTTMMQENGTITKMEKNGIITMMQGNGTITMMREGGTITTMLGYGTITKKETMVLGDGKITILVDIVRNPST
ncbi:hypothetical protein RDI58_029189 [Solanum bulbocastanum]|uniref:Uncharacterized protein n=1 Tax=Solanum bulbocastanum TaxID=147425 RepID=A0AAN8XZD0_SOLBU